MPKVMTIAVRMSACGTGSPAPSRGPGRTGRAVDDLDATTFSATGASTSPAATGVAASRANLVEELVHEPSLALGVHGLADDAR